MDSSKYEFKKGETLDLAIDFALGFTPNADQASISIRRRNDYGQYEVISSQNRSDFILKNGDVILVNELQGDDRGYILVEGAIRNAGLYSFNKSLQFSDYINQRLVQLRPQVWTQLLQDQAGSCGHFFHA